MSQGVIVLQAFETILIPLNPPPYLGDTYKAPNQIRDQ